MRKLKNGAILTRHGEAVIKDVERLYKEKLREESRKISGNKVQASFKKSQEWNKQLAEIHSKEGNGMKSYYFDLVYKKQAKYGRKLDQHEKKELFDYAKHMSKALGFIGEKE